MLNPDPQSESEQVLVKWLVSLLAQGFVAHLIQLPLEFLKCVTIAPIASKEDICRNNFISLPSLYHSERSMITVTDSLVFY